MPLTGPLVTTVQWGGFGSFAVSSANEEKLEINDKDNITIWDGFQEIKLVSAGINFWMTFTMMVHQKRRNLNPRRIL